MTFVGISRLALAVRPSSPLILVGGLVWGLGNMFGIGPLFGWVWALFAAASLWWPKALIAVGALGATAFFVWLQLSLAQWIYEEFR